MPPVLVEPFERARSLLDRHSPTVDQAALADFIQAEGHLARHIRRMRSLYAERHATLVRLAQDHLAGVLDVKPTEAGLHLIGWLPEGVDDGAVSRQAQAAGLETPAVSTYSLGTPPSRGGLLLGFSAFDAQLGQGVARLATVPRTAANGPPRPETAA